MLVALEYGRYLMGCVVGLLLGLTGGGGSLLLPTFSYLFEQPVQLATGYTLILTGASALIGLLPRIPRREIDYAAAATLAVPVLLGTLLVRGWLFELIPDPVFSVGRLECSKRAAIMFVFAAVVLLSWATMIGLTGKNLQPNPDFRLQQRGKYFSILIVSGGLIGALSALVGAGGGVMLVPLMVIVMQQPIKTVVGTTLMVVAIKSIVGFSGDLWAQASQIDWWFLAGFFSTMVVGVLAGSHLASRVDSDQLKKGFAWLLLLIAISVVAKELLAG